MERSEDQITGARLADYFRTATDQFESLLTTDELDQKIESGALSARDFERALDYASKAADFAEKSGKIATTVQNVVGWLGNNWTKLLPLVGLAV